jgi:hypothetical protein
MTTSRRWRDLSSGQRKSILGLGAVEAALTAWALTDLRRRPADQVRGPKAAWAAACFVQPVGPPAYLLLGRRR